MRRKYLLLYELPKVYKIFIFFGEKDKDNVLNEIKEKNIRIHIDKIKKEKIDEILRLNNEFNDLLKIISKFIDEIEGVGSFYSMDLNKIKEKIDYLKEKIYKNINELKEINEKIKELEKKIELLKCILKKYGVFVVREYNYIGNYIINKFYILNGKIEGIKYEKICNNLILITDRADKKDLIYKFESLGILKPLFESKDNLFNLIEIIKRYEIQLENLKERKKELENRIKNIILENKQLLIDLYYTLTKLKDLGLIYSSSKYLYYIEGYIVKEDLNKISFPYEITTKFDTIPPSLLEYKSKISRAFSLITRMFGIPSYYEYDPTPFIAITFPFFFGIMLSDFFYGVILAIIGFILYKKKIEDLGIIFLIAGISASIFGLIFGSFFGDFLKKFFGISFGINITPKTLLGISIGIGVVLTTITRIFSILIKLEKKEYLNSLEDLGIIILDLVLFNYVLQTLFNLTFIPYSLAILGIIFILIPNLVNYKLIGLLFSLMDLSGLLGDVLSFLRITALFLSTAYVASSFNTIVKTIPFSIILLPVLILIFIMLHFLNLFSSVLSSISHSLRLLFVELLPKFYEGRGYEFTPIQMKIKIKNDTNSINNSRS